MSEPPPPHLPPENRTAAGKTGALAVGISAACHGNRASQVSPEARATSEGDDR